MVLGVCVAALVAAPGCIWISPLALGYAELRETVAERSPRWIELNKVAIIDIDGFISGGGGRLWGLMGSSVADVKQRLDKAAEDGRVVAVVLRVDSPGGEATAADIIHRELRSFRASTRKPVVACMTGIGASGGYYVSLGADRIVAHPTCVTGSVGVIMHLLNVEGLYGKIGLRPVTIKSGEKKDMASPTRAMTEAERKILESINRSLYERFLDVVRESRPQMTPEQIEQIADGRVVTASQALDLGMVDQVGYLDEAVALAKDMAGVREANVVIYRSFPHVNRNIYAKAQAEEVSAASPGQGLTDALRRGVQAVLGNRGPRFLYLWAPGL